jgi:hypothetical protein
MRTNLSCTGITYIIATWLQLDDKFQSSGAMF